MRRAKRGKGGGAYLGGDRGGDAFDAFVRLGAVQGGGGGGPANGGGVLPAAGGGAGRRGGRTGRGCARGSGIGGRLSALQGRGWTPGAGGTEEWLTKRSHQGSANAPVRAEQREKTEPQIGSERPGTEGKMRRGLSSAPLGQSGPPRAMIAGRPCFPARAAQAPWRKRSGGAAKAARALLRPGAKVAPVGADLSPPEFPRRRGRPCRPPLARRRL